MSELKWTTVDTSELCAFTQNAYAEMKEAYKLYANAKRAFEDAMQEDFNDKLPSGAELKFGYNFGKLSVAIGPKTERKQAKVKQGLADWLAQQAGNGRCS